MASEDEFFAGFEPKTLRVDRIEPVNYIGWARYRHSGERTWLSLCDSDDEGAFRIYRLR